MDMAAKLCDLRVALPGCHVAAFVDLSAKMVMAHDARSKALQERLDDLAERALRLITMPGVAEPAPDHAICVSADNLEIFLRADPASDDSLVLVCGLRTEVTKAVETGLTLLKEFAADA
ncbi:MAG: hypothetical protein AAFZ10_13075 [Pseudomonadota bacterium]